ncbi:SpaA isopeptide-forming pilin-related protein [Candidatus Enterococcus ferrettii]|uniref:Gram-positive cocci surface proteins LPxTG domain-containing protein n=1 Tax=Candidatus Enterococcus ferrettii TaxID=2815324 RepID=A0ABV0ETB0_9ENTE|nr:SpaA isopeptide-forming pilin-related protein [Enterococcus sp. 665A]MBO1339293.1 cell wall protein [Enterococcus sp. 665A]
MNNQYTQRIIYGFMTILIFLQYLVPIVGIAETLNKSSNIEITKATVNKENDQDFVILEGNVRSSEEIEAKDIMISDGVLFEPQAQQNLVDIPRAFYSVETNKLTVHLDSGSKGEFSIKVPLNTKSLLEKKSFQLLTDDQSVSVQIPDELSKKGTLSDETTSLSENSIQEEQSDQATSASTESKVQPKEKEPAKIPAPQAEDPETATDIRTYFPDGNSTIINKAEASYYDKNGVLLTPPVPADATVRLHYDWSIPEDVRAQIKEGDYFTFQLPEGVLLTSTQEGDLTNDDGEVYAHYTVDENGQVKIVFNDRVTQESDINGTFNFDTEFDTTHIDGPGDTTITFPAEDNLPPITVPIRPATDTSIAKKGTFDRTPNPTEVKWEVDFNQGMENLSNTTITEQWPKGLTYESVVVYKLVMNLDGTVASVGEALSPDQYKVDKDGNVTILRDVSDAYRIEYHTSIDDSAIPEEGGKVSFTNTATLTDDNDPDGIDAKASVTNTYGKLLEKNGTGYDPSKQEFSWEIKYNYGEKNIPKKDAVITDTISDNMDLVADSVELHAIDFDQNGNEIVGRKLSAPQDYTLVPNPNGKGFVIQFANDVDEAVKVTYKTNINGLVTDPTQVNNKVEIGTGQQDEGNGTAQQQNVIKNYSNVNYADGELDWTIQVNQNKYYMENLVLTDTFSPVPGLSLSRTPEMGYQMTVVSSTGEELTAGTDYQLTQTYDSNGEETGFTIKFLGKYNPTEESFIIRYRTNFDISLLDPDTPDLDHFNNDIRADWQDENGGDHHSEDNSSFKPKPDYSLNAQKSGSYNAQNKHITWTIAVNLSRNLLKDAFLKDQIKYNQDYVANSLKVYEATTASDGTVTKDSDTPVNDKMTIDEPSPANNQTFDIRFPNESQHTYLIEFETSVEGKVVEASKNYDNVAEYSNNKDEREVTGEVSVKNGGSHIQKSGEQDPAKPDFVNWHLVINPAQSELDHVKVTDHPSSNQIIDQNSVALYGTTVAEDGTITPDRTKPLVEGRDYQISLTTDNVTGEQVLTVEFLHKISTAYYMDYRALISSSSTGSSDVVSNQVDITGDGTYVIKDDGGKDVTVGLNTSGGSANGTKGKITLKKTKEDGATSLTGAHFQLWDTTKTLILREGDVDENGEITFGNLILGDYLLVETKAPDGYTIPDDLVQGRRIEITANTSVEGATPTAVINEPNKVLLTKSGENKDRLAGAEFMLQKRSALGIWQTQAGGPYVTNQQGILGIDSLAPGHYRLTETKAPADYVIDTTPIEFYVIRNGNNQIPTVELDMINYQGSAQLLKQDDGQNALAGATFKIVDASGKTVKDNLTSDTNGQISVTGLAPGEYRFVETKAPSGFVLNQREYPFTIVDRAVGKPTTVKVGAATNYQGSAELVKQDENGNVLSGAVFQVKDSAGNVVKDNLTSNQAGKVEITNLAPGSYKIFEIKAPDGYLINTIEKNFDISAAAMDKPVTIEIGAFQNYQGSVKIRKVNTLEEPLRGSEFTLFDSNKESLNITKTSNPEGWIQFDDLAPGVYYLQETKAPLLPDGSSYVVNPYLIRVEIPESANGKPTVINLGDFQNFKGKAQITKEGNGAPIANAHFDLYLSDPATGLENLIGELISDSDGNIPLDGLGAGSYKLIETKPAPGYILNTQPIYFVVNPDLESGPIDAFSFVNYQSTVEGTKVDGDGLTQGDNQLLAGAEFQVYEQNEDGSRGTGPVSFYDKEDQSTETVRTDNKGNFLIKGLEERKYLLVETKAPDNFALSTKEIPFEVRSSLGKPEAINLGKIDNYRGKLDIQKVDEEGKSLIGGTFVLSTTADGRNPVKVINSDKKEVEELHASDGHIKAQGIKPGTYYLVETEAPTGFVLNTEPIKVVIPASSENPQQLSVSGELVNYQGTAELTKKNAAGNNLAGAEFKIIDAEKKAVQEGLVSNESGVVTAKYLAPGKYQFVETKAPKGYILNTTPIDFTIDEKAAGKPSVEVASKNVINYQGSAELTKVNVQKELLQGAEFKVVNQDNVSVAESLVSDSQGKIKLDNLQPGTYYFVETKAPSGYSLNKHRIEFTIESSAQGAPARVNAGNFINEKQGETVPPSSSHSGSSYPQAGTTTRSRLIPQLNDPMNQLLIVIGIGIVAAGIIFWRKQRNAK